MIKPRLFASLSARWRENLHRIHKTEKKRRLSPPVIVHSGGKKTLHRFGRKKATKTELESLVHESLGADRTRREDEVYAILRKGTTSREQLQFRDIVRHSNGDEKTEGRELSRCPAGRIVKRGNRNSAVTLIMKTNSQVVQCHLCASETTYTLFIFYED